MRKILYLLLFFVMILLACSHSHAKDYVVKKVIDGDTIMLDNGETVRYLGIDAPEIHKKEGGSDFFAREASRYNRKLVFMKKVRLEYDVEKKDKYGRILAYVFVKNLFVNGELVRLGYAKAMVRPPNVKYRNLLLDYQKKAMSAEKGLWQEKKRDTETLYIGNKRTYTLHRPSCKFAKEISDKNRITFHNRTDAIKIGYIPCKVCKP